MAWRMRVAGDTMHSKPGYHGFGAKVGFKGADGAEWGSVLWGGTQGELVMIEVKGERTPELVSAVRELVPDHRCTRVDSCVDLEEPGLWDRLLPIVLRIKAAYKLRGERRGDWDFPEDGRTQYLGAPSSAVRARMYEKGKEPLLRHLGRGDWVRVETQVRPEKAARTAYAAASAMEVWGASPYTRDLAACVLEAQVQPLPPYAGRRENARDRAIRFMCQQYGAHLLSLKEDLGDWQSVGLTLWETIKEQRGRRGRR
jgi:hypothetical protein